MYGGHFPDRDEEFWDYVTPRELGQALTVETMQKHKVLIMLLSQYRAEHIDDITDMLDDDQQEIVQAYVNDPTLSSKTIVVANNKIIDGNHRALAAAIKGVRINYVDLAELDEEPIDEAELDSTGWGATPQGTDVDYFGLKVKMRPSTFLKLSHPLNAGEQNPDVEKHMQGGGKIAYPFLEIKDPVEWEDGDFSQHGKVVNHEGRNRMTHWIKMKGDEPIQVNLFLRGANRRRYVTDDMIQALSQGLISQTGQLVKNPFEGSTALDEEINPDCFNPAFNDTQEFDGLTYRATVEEEYGKPILVIKVLDNFQPVGLAKFKQSKDSVVSLISSFRPEYQGKGIARNVYAYVRMLGNTIQPSKNQLPPGKAMWQSWKKSGDAKHLMKENVIGKLHIDPLTIEIDQHAIDRAGDRNIRPELIDQILRKLPKLVHIMANVKTNKFWVFDPKFNIKIGLAKSDTLNLYRLNTVVKNPTYDSDVPTITLK